MKELILSMELDSTEGLLSAVEAGLGVTFVSRWAVRNQIALGTLKLFRVAGLKLSRNFSMAYATGPEPPGTVGAFRGFLLCQALNCSEATKDASQDYDIKRKLSIEQALERSTF
jgi:LysR family transcriptional regulator, transcriptional activator of the cysJI operon